MKYLIAYYVPYHQDFYLSLNETSTLSARKITHSIEYKSIAVSWNDFRNRSFCKHKKKGGKNFGSVSGHRFLMLKERDSSIKNRFDCSNSKMITQGGAFLPTLSIS